VPQGDKTSCAWSQPLEISHRAEDERHSGLSPLIAAYDAQVGPDVLSRCGTRACGGLNSSSLVLPRFRGAAPRARRPGGQRLSLASWSGRASHSAYCFSPSRNSLHQTTSELDCIDRQRRRHRRVLRPSQCAKSECRGPVVPSAVAVSQSTADSRPFLRRLSRR
jgi:hypothetical protein